MMMQNAPLALAEYQKALSLGIKQPEFVYYDIGLTKEMVHDSEGAIAAYRHAIVLNPKDWRAYNAIGEAYVQQGSIDEGVLNLRKAKAAAPDRLDIRQNLGAALCNSGRHADAIVEFEELLQLDPDWNMARRCLAKSLRAVGRLDEAQKVQDEYNRRETQQ
jgi:tetratricopeptide (TPR) repeat protein